MLSIKDIMNKKLCGLVRFKGYFYALGGLNQKVFLTDNKYGWSENNIILPNNITELIIDKDQSFGVLVGGEYAYYAMDAIIEGVLELKEQQLYLSKVNKITLFDGEISQSFVFTD